MCAPSTVSEALGAVRAGLAFLNQVPAAGLPGVVQAECLRELAKAESAYTAAHARMLGAFAASGAHEDDGQQSGRAWLRWQTQVTKGAAAGAVGWMKRLAAHPAVRSALADGGISPSWARHICAWTDELPEDGRDDADQILLAAAAGGAVLPDLAALAEEMRRRTAAPDPDGPHGDAGFDERRVRLGLTFGGAGVLDGDLTPACAAALAAVLEALGKKAGPEDVRTAPQRRHDALEEACRRLIGAGCLPGPGRRSPTQVQLHLTLEQLRDLPGAADAEAAWTTAQAGAAAQPTAHAGPAGEPRPGPGTGRGRGAAGLADRPGRAGVCVRRGHHPHRHRHRGPGRARCPGRRTAGRPRRAAAPAVVGPPVAKGGGNRNRHDGDQCRCGGHRAARPHPEPPAIRDRVLRRTQPHWPGCTRSCSGTPPMFSPAPAGWPRSFAATSPGTRSPQSACRWTPAPPPA